MVARGPGLQRTHQGSVFPFHTISAPPASCSTSWQQRDKFYEQLWPNKSQEDSDGPRLGHVLVPQLITVPGMGTSVISRTLGPVFGLLWWEVESGESAS